MKHQDIEEDVRGLMRSRGPINGYGLTSGMFIVSDVPSPLPATLYKEFLYSSTHAVVGP